MSEEIRDKAFTDYRKGMKYGEIAEKYGVSLSAVKSWAARYWKKEGCNQKGKKSQPKKKKVATRGAQPENRNAVGHGGTGPPGNKNAVKTGEFETLFFDALDSEEKQLISSVPKDKEELLFQEIQLLTVRERRMLKRIEDIQTSVEYRENGEPVQNTDMTLVKRRTGIASDKVTDLREYQGKLGQIQAIEEALTRVQARKQKAIDSLHRFGFDDTRLEIELLKLDLVTAKMGGQDNEMTDDGFLDALNVEAAALWGDADGD